MDISCWTGPDSFSKCEPVVDVHVAIGAIEINLEAPNIPETSTGLVLVQMMNRSNSSHMTSPFQIIFSVWDCVYMACGGMPNPTISD